MAALASARYGSGQTERKSCLTFELGWVRAQVFVLRGIRTYDGFAEELYGHLPEFTRARNARAKMSNRVSDMNAPEGFPYCFWHPDIPGERMLRDLLERYPNNELLRYHVGRAYAAGGYASLCPELDLLPDVAIVEDARDNHVRAGHLRQHYQQPCQVELYW